MVQTTTPTWADEKHVTRTYGLGHTVLYNLRKKGLVRSVAVRAEGAKYGKRLFHIASVEAFLAACEARETLAEAAAARGAVE